MLSGKIIFSIPNAIRAIRRIAASSLDDEISFQQFRILSLTYEGLNQTQMSQVLQVSMAAISKTVDPLVKKKFLIRSVGKDRRCLKLQLSKEGEKLRSRIKSEVELTLEKSFTKLTKKEQSELMKGLSVLDKLIGIVNED